MNWSFIKKTLGLVTTILIVGGIVLVLILNIIQIIEERRIDSTAPAEFKKITILNKDNILAGSVIKYKLDFCRYVDQSVKTDVLVSLLPQSNPALADIPLGVAYANPEARCAVVTPERIIPIETIPGDYKMQICGYYYVLVGRPPKPVCITSEQFTVKPALKQTVELNNIQTMLDNIRRNVSTPTEPVVATPMAIVDKMTPAPQPATPQPTWNYKVYSGGKQEGAYRQPENAVKKYHYLGEAARIVDTAGRDVTKELLDANR